MTLAFAEDPVRRVTSDGQFMLDLDGFDGPIDLLLQLARDKKIDLARLSITALAEQYIAFIEQARHLQLELAADYLVMAAWLAYLKSRLLIPAPDDLDEPTPDELAEALAFQLRRLEGMQTASEALAGRPRLGSSILPRGMGETFAALPADCQIQFTLFELLDAYADCRRKADRPAHYEIAPLDLESIEQALERLSEILGRLPDWSVLAQFIPNTGATPLKVRAQIAATFGASLELVKRGALTLRQDAPFGPIYIRGTDSA